MPAAPSWAPRWRDTAGISPTGAIGRDPEGEVFIRPQLGTGCGACAKAGPWENIQMAAREPAAGGIGFLDAGVSAPVGFPVLERGGPRQPYSPHWSRSARKRGNPASKMRFIAPARSYSSRTCRITFSPSS